MRARFCHRIMLKRLWPSRYRLPLAYSTRRHIGNLHARAVWGARIMRWYVGVAALGAVLMIGSGAHGARFEQLSPSQVTKRP